MSLSRRQWLQQGAALAAVAWPGLTAVPWIRDQPLRAMIRDPEVKALAMRALDAARQAGALFADLRITRSRERVLRSDPTFGFFRNPVELSEAEELGFGVRALVSGYWGFASSNVLLPDEAARLGREAVAQARANTLGRERVVDLGKVAPASGHWDTPIEIDPFTVPLDEMIDFAGSVSHLSRDRRAALNAVRVLMVRRREVAFASTEGAFTTQTLHRAGLDFTAGFKQPLSVPRQPGRSQMGGAWGGNMLTQSGRGWEYLSRAPIHEEIRRLRAEAEEIERLPVVPTEVGRYDVAMDSASTARLLQTTLGPATELDRALGFEANASGTSYLNDPTGMIGTHQVGATALTLTADRSMTGGLATVKWDDEGVEPETFTLVKDGILQDYQTTRESVAWLKEPYARLGRALRSHGCASATTGLESPMAQIPNLRMAPGAQALGFRDLVSQLGNGIAATGLMMRADFQALTGVAGPWGDGGALLKVVRGKAVGRFDSEHSAFLLRSPELWKSILTLGGKQSLAPLACAVGKGQPYQEFMFTVEAPPMVAKQLTFIDPTRTA